MKVGAMELRGRLPGSTRLATAVQRSQQQEQWGVTAPRAVTPTSGRRCGTGPRTAPSAASSTSMPLASSSLSADAVHGGREGKIGELIVQKKTGHLDARAEFALDGTGEGDGVALSIDDAEMRGRDRLRLRGGIGQRQLDLARAR